MNRISKVNWQNKTDEVKQALALHTPENYLKVILQNYFLYNAVARADMAQILDEKWRQVRKTDPRSVAVQKNIFLEIYSKLIQVSEDLALIGMMFLYGNTTRQAFEIFMEGTNAQIMSFYKMAYVGFGDKQMVKIMGLDKLQHYISSNKKALGKDEIKDYEYIISESIKIERKNLQMLARINIEEIEQDGKKELQQGGPIHVYNGVKHGFKVVYNTPLAKKLWPELNDETVDVMHRVLLDTASGQKIISIGGFGKMDEKIVEHIKHNINIYSEQIQHICEMRLWGDKDIKFVIQRLRLSKAEEEMKKRKIGVNEICPCGSEHKFKKCCKLFKEIYEKSDPYALVNEMS